MDEQIVVVSMLQKYEKIIEYPNLTIQEKRKILSVFVEEVILHEDKRVEIVYRPIVNPGSDDERDSGITHENIIPWQINGRS